MGTNYYFVAPDPCPTCGRGGEHKHIGKSSCGWYFALHVYPEEDVHDLSDWMRLWLRKGWHIEDEYKEKISIEQMICIIVWRGFEEGSIDLGFDFHKNHAERGPRGLIRSVVDGSHCIGHGVGPWDLIVGEFS